MKWLLLFFSIPAFAGSNTQTPPKGIFGIRLNQVFVTGTDYEYNSSGSKGTVGDLHSKNLFDELVRKLQAAGFGAYGVNLSGGNALDLGKMKMDVASTSTVFNPTLMYGVTDRWMTIVNVPYVNIKYDIKWSYVPGAMTPLIDGASQLASLANINLPNSSQFVSLAQQSLAQKGFKEMTSREKSFIGDALWMNMFNLGKMGALSFGTMNTISLPTGPKHDPNDLLDVGSFHHTYVEQEVTSVYAFSKKFQTYASGSVRYNLPEKTDFRVPKDENDLDPDITQLETVTRTVGMTKFAEAGFKYRLLPRWQLLTGLAYKSRDADKFSGSKGSNYASMSKIYPYVAETASIFKLALTYDPLTHYKLGSIPLMADISYEETFAGTNTPAIKQIILSLSTFF